MTPTQLRKKLKPHNPYHVASITGLSLETVRKIMRGESNVRKTTVKLIGQYIDSYEKLKKL